MACYILISTNSEKYLIKIFHTISGEFCFEVSLTSLSWAKENSWALGSCSSDTVHENYKTHKEECCLPSGQYTLECKDSAGDGWKGGYIMIDGKTYCESFYSGKIETHEVLIGPNTKEEGMKRL